MQMIPIHDLTSSARDTHRTWLRHWKHEDVHVASRSRSLGSLSLRHRPTGMGAMMRVQGIQSLHGGLTSPVQGMVTLAMIIFIAASTCSTASCTHRLPGGSAGCRADLAVTSPVGSLWLGLAHTSPRPLEPDDVSDSDDGKGKGKGNDDDDNGDGGGGDGGTASATATRVSAVATVRGHHRHQ